MLRTMKLRMLAAALPLLLVVGCTASQPEPDETYVSASDVPADPASSATLTPLEPDVTLVIRATVTDGSGTPVTLELRAHRSTPWDDVAAQALPDAMAATCADLSSQRFEAEVWSFTRINVAAVAESTAVFSGSVRVVASAGDAPVVARGDLVDAASPADPCHATTDLPAGGQGGLAIGIAGDGAASTAWASGVYGFVAPDGVELSDCTVEVTELGDALGGGSKWITRAAEGECISGSGSAVEAITGMP